MIYLDMLRSFSDPGDETDTGWAHTHFANGLADIIYSVALALIVLLLFNGDFSGPVHPGVVAGMALAFSFGGALGISKWIGAWRIMRNARRKKHA